MPQWAIWSNFNSHNTLFRRSLYQIIQWRIYTENDLVRRTPMHNAFFDFMGFFESLETMSLHVGSTLLEAKGIPKLYILDPLVDSDASSWILNRQNMRTAFVVMWHEKTRCNLKWGLGVLIDYPKIFEAIRAKIHSWWNVSLVDTMILPRIARLENFLNLN